MLEPARHICGVVLAAGAGMRMGRPKVLMTAPDGTPWVALAVRMLRDAGCHDVIVALGASAERAAPLVPAEASVVVIDDWSVGVSATLRGVLAALEGSLVDAVLITPVDTPDAPAEAARRVLGEGLGSESKTSAASLSAALARATYGGVPGHPVLIGRAHWHALSAGLAGDRGAGGYLAAQGALAVECGDLWSGADVDTP